MSGNRYFTRNCNRNGEKIGTEFAKLRNVSRYGGKNINSPSFWEDSDDENVNTSRMKKSWADRSEELENDLHSPIKRDKCERFRKPKQFGKRINHTQDESMDSQTDSCVSVKKRGNLKDMFSLSEFCTTSDSGSETNKRRSKRSASDCVSTTSSSIHSSDAEMDGERFPKRYETDPVVLRRRQKQIDYGKNTKAYKAYLKAVPIEKREIGKHVFTPKKHLVYSRRSWDSQIKIWRRRLHEYDPEDEDEDDEVDLSDMVALMSPK